MGIDGWVNVWMGVAGQDEAHMRQYAARLRTPDTLDEIDKMTDVIELLEAAVADEAAGAHVRSPTPHAYWQFQL
jgi:hypothetical protein